MVSCSLTLARGERGVPGLLPRRLTQKRRSLVQEGPSQAWEVAQILLRPPGPLLEPGNGHFGAAQGRFSKSEPEILAGSLEFAAFLIDTAPRTVLSSICWKLKASSLGGNAGWLPSIERAFLLSPFNYLQPPRSKVFMRTAAGLVALLMACDSPVSVTPPAPSPAPEPPKPQPIVHRQFSWADARGFSAFAALAGDWVAGWQDALAHGRNTARVCAETEYWDDVHPFVRVPRDLQRLEQFLAQVPTKGQVLLVANCTLKGPVPFEEQTRWNEDVSRLAARHPHVALEVVNEPLNCEGRGWGPYCLPPFEVKELIRQSLRLGVSQVGADHYRLDRHPFVPPGTFASFHPRRDSDPTRHQLRELVRLNSGLAVLSETICYDPGDEFGGLCTNDMSRIQAFEERCEGVEGCVFFYHSREGLAGFPSVWP